MHPPLSQPKPFPFGSIVTGLLAAAAAVYLGYHLGIAVQPDDTNHLETPLALAAARQVEEGPGVLYGPFSGRRPLVLIHAPLYYRLTGLAAWVLSRGGVDTLTAAFAAGRALALLGLIGTMAAAAGLARLDGAPARAGLWAALLIAASPVIGSFPVTVRPDTLGLALQTAAVLLVWTHLRAACAGGSGSGIGVAVAYVLFALAACVKQHDLVAAGVSSMFLLVAAVQRRVRLGPLLAAHAVGLAVVLGYYGLEQWVTGGCMAESVFVLPAAFGRINRASWGHVATVFVEVAKMAAGLGAVALACLAANPRKAVGHRFDGVLGVYLAAELAATVALCLNSTGAWTNYAMQAVVFAAILLGRALDRVLAGSPGCRLAPVALAALLVLAVDARLVAISAGNRQADAASLQALFHDPSVGLHGPDELYFVGAPQHNRRFGRADLAHDEWLYTSYEALHAAQPRSEWLRQALVEGSVRQVIVIGSSPRLRGLDEPLPRLGYRPITEFGRYVVWQRGPAPAHSLAGAGPRLSQRGRP